MSLFAELKRRNVIRVAIAYIVSSWLTLQVADIILPAVGAPDWVLRALLVVLAIGFVPSLIFAWAFELTPEGLKREQDVDRSQSIGQHTAKRLDIAVIVFLVIVGVLSVTNWKPGNSGSDPTSPGNSALTQTAQPVPTDGRVAIAVLPFENMSTDAENGYFADGISEEILNLLADVNELSVASRTSAFAFKGKDTPIPEIAAALGVGFVLEGSVRKSGDQVRVTAQLIDAGSDRHLWSETYDRTLEDIFAIQDEIAGAIGSALQIELLGTSGEQVQSEAIDPDVFAHFLQARHLLRQRGQENIAQGIEILLQIVEDEPGFARGHVLLGEAYLLSGSFTFDPEGRSLPETKARLHAELARAINPDLAGIYLILGNLSGSDLLAKLKHYDRAIELEPDEPRPYHWRAIAHMGSGHLDRALWDARTAVRLEAGNIGAMGTLGSTLGSLGRLEDAKKVAMEMVAQSGQFAHVFLGALHLLTDDLDDARASFDLFVAETDADPVFFDAVLAYAENPEKLPELEQAIREGRHGGAFELHATLSGLLLFDQVLERPPEEFVSFDFMRWNPRLQEMRRDSRFQLIMEATGSVAYWREFGPPPDCRPVGDSFECGHGYPEGYASEDSVQ
jgi:TolB-like protein/Flp pilus assembly protein TadD